MFALENKEVLVIGLGGRGRAACELLCRHGAKVIGVDTADTADLRDSAEKLRPLGVTAGHLALEVRKARGDFGRLHEML